MCDFVLGIIFVISFHPCFQIIPEHLVCIVFLFYFSVLISYPPHPQWWGTSKACCGMSGGSFIFNRCDQLQQLCRARVQHSRACIPRVTFPSCSFFWAHSIRSVFIQPIFFLLKESESSLLTNGPTNLVFFSCDYRNIYFNFTLYFSFSFKMIM